MVIGDRLRSIREEKKLSQGDIEKRTGLLRCYVSRVENGHTVPAVETMEKFARALEVSMYQLFYDGNKPPELPTSPRGRQRTALPGAVQGKTLATWRSFGDSSARQRKETETCYFQWLRKSQPKRLLALTARSTHSLNSKP